MGSTSSTAKLLFYTKGTIKQLSLMRGKCRVAFSPSSAYSRVCGEERYIELYQEGRESESSEVMLRTEKSEFSVDKSISLELLLQLKRDGGEIKLIVENDAIVGIQF